MLRLFRSIRTKILILITIAAVTPMLVISFLFAGRLYRMITSDIIRQEQAAISQTAPILTGAIRDITGLSDEVRQMPYARSLFDKPLSHPVTTHFMGFSQQKFSNDVGAITEGTRVSAIRIYLDLPAEDPAFAALSEGSIIESLDAVRSAYWRGIFDTTSAQTLFCPPLYLNANEERIYGDCAYIQKLHVRDSSGIPVTAYLVTYFHSADLQSLLSDNILQRGSVSYITNERDAMVTSTDESLSGIYYMDYQSIVSNLMSSNGFLTRQVLGEEVYVASYYLAAPRWVLVTVTPSKPILARTQALWRNFIALWISIAALSILLAWFLSRSITRRISAVSDQMSRVKNDLPVPMESPTELDEIGDLIDSYNYMARQINSLMEDKERAAKELRAAEFTSLQAQINPHFLYNTMEMINWMAQQGRTKETSDAIHSLSRFYKLTLSRREPISSIAEEIEHVTIYVKLQNMRFDDGIDFVVDIPDNLLEYHMPSLTLQPIVENSILHGILEKENKRGTIVLTGWQEDDSIVLLVSDDGVGMMKEQCKTVLDKKQASTATSGNHIAVYNTHRRLQILYGERYGLTYRSTKMQGTEVEIRFPAT